MALHRDLFLSRKGDQSSNVRKFPVLLFPYAGIYFLLRARHFCLCNFPYVFYRSRLYILPYSPEWLVCRLLYPLERRTDFFSGESARIIIRGLSWRNDKNCCLYILFLPGPAAILLHRFLP